VIPWGGLTLSPDFDDYTDEEFAPIHGRTMLFNIEPIGIGTAQCEGLTSYIVRLAREHSLPMRRFVSRLLFSRTPDSQPRCDAKFFRQYAATINGVGSYAQRFAHAMNAATGRSDLELLTLRPWRGLLASNGNRLTSSWRRWCPDCLSSYVSEGLHDVYWPLAWSMASVQHCHPHGVPLADRCPHCARRQPAIPRLADFARCDACRRSLIDSVVQSAASTQSAVAPSPALSVAEQLIAINGSVDPDTVHPRWAESVSLRIAEMGLDRAAFCRRVGLNPRAMNAWINKGSGLSIDSLIKVLGGLDVSISDVLFRRRSSRRVRQRPAGSSSKTPRRRQSHPIELRVRASSLLDEAVAADEPVRLNEVATALGASTGFLRYWYPTKVALLRQRHLDIERAAREARQERHRHAVAAAVEQLISKGVYPGRKKVEAAVRARGASLIEPHNFTAYQSAVRASSRRS
jgi:hypothetical protein